MGLFQKKEPVQLPPPRHIAIIMDGNGRWARKRGLPRTARKSRLTLLTSVTTTAMGMPIRMMPRRCWTMLWASEPLSPTRTRRT